MNSPPVGVPGSGTPSSPPVVLGSPGSPLVFPPHMNIPERIITRRTRTTSMSGRIEMTVKEGTVKLFCRSRGHGFIEPADGSDPVFMHITDIDGEYIPRKGDKVRYRYCPMPPKFDKMQAVHIEIVDFTPEVHHKWCEKETEKELEEDRLAVEEEKELLNKKGAHKN